ncbi:Transcription initiation factor IIE subunit beta [Meloidogyne graminicola]|uniref:Transcription initiation factor IIE subunit beta n=1 Tax=Meloidogyne graminicola TaxID=189291 RepID=A0A8S9ZZJ9_9BILA|nr:Transcription initiation factor IIE subunit beta [Meloidogyne graminicola]
MDPALLKQRQDFMRQAIRSMDTMQQIKKDSTEGTSSSTVQQKSKKKRVAPIKESKSTLSSTTTAANNNNAIQNAANFSMMARIIDYMRKRHLNIQQWGLTLTEVLDEMQVYDLNKKTLLWLQEALKQNPRLEVDAENKLIYKPPHRVKNKATLLALLKKQHTDGKGGILLSELGDCVANPEALVKALGPQCIDLPTQINKRKDTVLFFNDEETDYQLDEEFIQLWRSAGVEHLDETKIEEYLQKHGLETARDLAPGKKVGETGNAPKRKQSKKAIQKVHNVHLEDVLEDYAAD